MGACLIRKLTLNDGKENIIDVYCSLIAATELFKATKKDIYKSAADVKAKDLMSRLTTDGKYKNYWRADNNNRPFFHPSDAGMPIVCLLNYVDISDNSIKEQVLDVVKKSMVFELEITSEVTNPFGYSRQYTQNIDGERKSCFFFPHKTETSYWWQGENARLGSMATAARLASGYFKSDNNFYNKLQAFALNQINWILGENPFDCCMLQGSGRNNPPYSFKNSVEYMNAPGGICNGITSGYTNPNDIDFNLPFNITNKDDDWRWGEQWLPHATWFMLAVASGN